MGYREVKRCAKGFQISDGSTADKFGEYIFNEMYEATELISEMHDEKVEKLEAIIKKLKLLMTDEMGGMTELDGRLAWYNKRNKYLEELRNETN